MIGVCSTNNLPCHPSSLTLPRLSQTPCPPGSFSASPSQSTCTSCEAGKFQSDEARDECISCTAGHFCPASSIAPLPCLPGSTFQPDASQTSCKSCSNCPVGEVVTEGEEKDGLNCNLVSTTFAHPLLASLSHLAISLQIVPSRWIVSAPVAWPQPTLTTVSHASSVMVRASTMTLTERPPASPPLSDLWSQRIAKESLLVRKDIIPMMV